MTRSAPRTIWFVLAAIALLAMGLAGGRARAEVVSGAACTYHAFEDTTDGKGLKPARIIYGTIQNDPASTGVLPLFCPIRTSSSKASLKSVSVLTRVSLLANKNDVITCKVAIVPVDAFQTGGFLPGATRSTNPAMYGVSAGQFLLLAPPTGYTARVYGLLCKVPPGGGITAYETTEQ